jgi:titin
LLPGSSYQVRVAAVNVFGRSAYLVGSATTLVVAASVPTGFTLDSVTSNKVTLSWSAPSSNGGAMITGYKIELSGDSGLTWTVIEDGGNNSLGVTVSSLASETAYQFRVSAVSVFGVGLATSPLTVVTQKKPRPAAPTGMQIIALKSTAVAVSWKAPVLPNGVKVSDYFIDISEEGGAWMTVAKKVSTMTSMSIANLHVASNYQIRVSAKATTGISDYLEISFTTLPSAPQAPNTLTFTDVSTSSFLLSWLPGFNGGDSIKSYLVEIRAGTSSWAIITRENSADSNFELKNLLPGVKYSARVKALNSVGISKLSPIYTVTTLSNTPSRPSSLALKSLSKTTTVVTWEAPYNGGSKVSDYQVKYSMDQGQTWSVATKTLSATTSLSLKGLKEKTNYWFIVAARNSVGLSEFSQVLSISTP